MTSNSAGPPLFTPATPANESLSSSSYFPSNQSSTTARPHHGNVARDRPTLAIDPIALVTTECITITSAMRKNARWAHSSVASILGGGGSATQSASNLLDNSRPATPLPGTPMSSKVPKLNRDTDELATNRWGLRGKKGKSIQVSSRRGWWILGWSPNLHFVDMNWRSGEQERGILMCGIGQSFDCGFLQTPGWTVIM